MVRRRTRSSSAEGEPRPTRCPLHEPGTAFRAEVGLEDGARPAGPDAPPVAERGYSGAAQEHLGRLPYPEASEVSGKTNPTLGSPRPAEFTNVPPPDPTCNGTGAD